MEHRADDKRARGLLKEFELSERSKGLDAPIVKETDVEKDSTDDALSAQEATRFRALAARANYLALDRPDI